MAYARDQIFRRPAPTSAAGNLPYAYMEWLEGEDVSNDAELNPADLAGGTPYDQCYINPEGLAMEPMGFSADLVDGVINWCSPGLYIAQFVVIWADSGWPNPSFVQTSLEFIGASVSLGNCCAWGSRDYIHDDWQTDLFEATGMLVADDENDCDITPQGIQGKVWQKSGTDKFLSQAALIICRLAEFDNDSGSFCQS